MNNYLTRRSSCDGNRSDYQYDPVGRLTGIWAPNNQLTSFVYDDGGRLTEKWFPNGVNTQYTYNPDNTLSQLINRHGSGVTISEHDYTYDLVGNRKTQNELIAGTLNPYTYAYDELNRLTTVTNTGTGAMESYAYDPLGNRRTKTSGGSTLAYVNDAANQLTEIHQGSLAGPLTAGLVYDNNGNLTKKCEGGTVTVSPTTCTGNTVTDLTVDDLNRPTQIAKTGIATQTYKYDDSGRRIQKVNGSATTNYLYNGSQIVDQYDDTWGVPTFNYVYGPGADAPTIRASSTTTQFYHQNGIGNVVAVTNQTGSTDGTAAYDAYGNLTASTGTIPTYGFTGREPDETGLVYYRARYYDPMIGRFLQKDPIGFRGGSNRYVYVNNNPTNLVDPEGELAFFWHGWITYNVARDRGYSISFSLGTAVGAMLPDFNIVSTWRNTQADQTIHAAGGSPAPGDPRLLPPEVIAAARESATRDFATPDFLANLEGIHTVEDIPAHEGLPLIPEGTPWWQKPIVIAKHLLGDLFPSSDVREAAYEEANKGFEAIENNMNRSLDIEITPLMEMLKTPDGNNSGSVSGSQSLGTVSPVAR